MLSQGLNLIRGDLTSWEVYPFSLSFIYFSIDFRLEGSSLLGSKLCVYAPGVQSLTFFLARHFSRGARATPRGRFGAFPASLALFVVRIVSRFWATLFKRDSEIRQSTKSAALRPFPGHLRGRDRLLAIETVKANQNLSLFSSPFPARPHSADSAIKRD